MPKKSGREHGMIGWYLEALCYGAGKAVIRAGCHRCGVVLALGTGQARCRAGARLELGSSAHSTCSVPCNFNTIVLSGQLYSDWKEGGAKQRPVHYIQWKDVMHDTTLFRTTNYHLRVPNEIRW